jgi:5-methylcytosine-specific restriction endonuclease McrA
MTRKRVYKKGAEGSEYDYHAQESVKKDRAARNKARREAMAEGRVKKGDGLEVDHRKPLSKGGSASKGNTRVVTREENRKKYNKTTTKKKGK